MGIGVIKWTYVYDIKIIPDKTDDIILGTQSSIDGGKR